MTSPSLRGDTSPRSTPDSAAATTQTPKPEFGHFMARRLGSLSAPISEAEEPPKTPPENPGVVGNCLLCLPEGTLSLLGLTPNMDDKGASEKRLWFGRVWQLRALLLRRYRRLALECQPSLSASQKREVSERMADPSCRALMVKVQKMWRGAVTRRAASLSSVLGALDCHMAPYAGAVIFMHGSDGMTYNNVRYARKLASLGYIVIAPDSMAGGEFRHRDLAGHIPAHQPTPYWDDLGLYSSQSEGVYAQDTKPEEVVKNPECYRKLYENVFRMRSAEMHWILGRLPLQMKLRGVFTMGQSEGAMTVARFDDRRYGAMIRGRIIAAFSVEYCYFTPTREAAEFGGSEEVATLNIMGDADQYFGPYDSVAKKVKDDGLRGGSGWGAATITGNAFKQMQRQRLRRGLAVVLEGAKHDASETHDNFLRDLLRAFLASPSDCHRIPDQWKPDVYLSSKVTVQEVDDIGGGCRVLVHVGKMDFDSKMPYGEEVFRRGAAAMKIERAAREPLRRALGVSLQRSGDRHLANGASGSAKAVQAGMFRPLCFDSTAPSPMSPLSIDYRISIEKGPCASFGFRVDPDLAQPALRVDWIDPHGALGAWGAKNVARAVRENDLIIGVNHVGGDVEAMFAELVRSQRADLIVRPHASRV